METKLVIFWEKAKNVKKHIVKRLAEEGGGCRNKAGKPTRRQKNQGG